MKKILFGLLAILLLLSFAGCGAKDKLEKKAGEALAEKIIEGAGGEDVDIDVDIDGDIVKIKGENGEEMIFGETEWPTSDLANNIPEFEGGKIVTVMEMNDSLLISLEEASKEDFVDYLDEIKNTFTKESYNMTSEENVTYAAENDEGIGIMLTYTADKFLSITLAKTSQ